MWVAAMGWGVWVRPGPPKGGTDGEKHASQQPKGRRGSSSRLKAGSGRQKGDAGCQKRGDSRQKGDSNHKKGGSNHHKGSQPPKRGRYCENGLQAANRGRARTGPCSEMPCQPTPLQYQPPPTPPNDRGPEGRGEGEGGSNYYSCQDMAVTIVDMPASDGDDANGSAPSTECRTGQPPWTGALLTCPAPWTCAARRILARQKCPESEVVCFSPFFSCFIWGGRRGKKGVLSY